MNLANSFHHPFQLRQNLQMVYVRYVLSYVSPDVSFGRRTSHKKKRYIDTFSLVCHSGLYPEEMLVEAENDDDVVAVVGDDDEETFELPLAIPCLFPKFLPVLPSSKYLHLFSLRLRQCFVQDLTCFEL